MKRDHADAPERSSWRFVRSMSQAPVEVEALNAAAVELDVVELAFELAQLLVQRGGFVGDPIPAEDETQDVLSPLCTVPGVRFRTGVRRSVKSPLPAECTG